MHLDGVFRHSVRAERVSHAGHSAVRLPQSVRDDLGLPFDHGIVDPSRVGVGLVGREKCHFDSVVEPKRPFGQN